MPTYEVHIKWPAGPWDTHGGWSVKVVEAPSPEFAEMEAMFTIFEIWLSERVEKYLASQPLPEVTGVIQYSPREEAEYRQGQEEYLRELAIQEME